MGKPKLFIKEETVKRITNLLKKYSREDLEKSKEFQSLSNHYINGFERTHLDTIVNLCYEGKTYDEIRFIIQGGNTSMSNKTKNTSTDNYDEIMDPVEEAVFMISQQKVVEVEPITIVIGKDNSDNELEQDEATKNVVNDDSDDLDDYTDPVILGNIGKEFANKSENKPVSAVKTTLEAHAEYVDKMDNYFNNIISTTRERVKQTHQENERLWKESRDKQNTIIEVSIDNETKDVKSADPISKITKFIKDTIGIAS